MRAGQIHLLFVVMYTLCHIACNNNKETTDTSITETPAAAAPEELIFDMLVGTWQNTDSKSFERWIKKENGSFKADAYSLKGSDTVWHEHASVYNENGNWIFDNQVTGQNEGRSVKFTSTQIDATTVQFSNPAHDFPTDINYTVTSDTTLHAFIIGPNHKGGKDTIPFNFRRIL